MNRTTKHKSRTPGIPNLSELTEQIEDNFFEAMHRPPRDGDRLFYWTYCYSDAEISSQMIATMLRANIPQRLIYVYDKTGLMVSDEAAVELGNDPAARDFVSDAFAHSKFIAYVASSLPLLKATLGDRDLDDGFIQIETATDVTKFVEGCRRLRFWERKIESATSDKTPGRKK